MQSKESLERFYKDKDPWGYKKNKSDRERKKIILDRLAIYSQFERALDIGAGEGWITKDLPAKEIHAIELSDKACERLPKNVARVKEPIGKYDLIIATGVFYKQYDHKLFHKWIKQSASRIVLTCNIEDWEIPLKSRKLEERSCEIFKYRNYRQALRIYEVAT